MQYVLEPRVCLQNLQFQGEKSRGHETYGVYDEGHRGAHDAEIGGF